MGVFIASLIQFGNLMNESGAAVQMRKIGGQGKPVWFTDLTRILSAPLNKLTIIELSQVTVYGSRKRLAGAARVLWFGVENPVMQCHRSGQ